MGMICPECQTELKIKEQGKLQLLNDDSPDKETEVYMVQELYCVNDKCSKNGEVVETVKHKMNT